MAMKVIWEYIGVILGIVKRNAKENGNYHVGFRVDVGMFGDITPTRESQMDIKMEDAMETRTVQRIVGIRVSET